MKLVLHWAHGIWPSAPEVPTLASLLVILGILATVTATSLVATRGGVPEDAGHLHVPGLTHHADGDAGPKPGAGNGATAAATGTTPEGAPPVGDRGTRPRPCGLAGLLVLRWCCVVPVLLR